MEELLKQLIEGQTKLFENQNQLFTEIKAIRNEMATKDDLKTLRAELSHDIENVIVEQQKDIKGMIEIVNDKVEPVPRIEAKIDVLAHRTFETEANINLLKKAK